MFTVVSHDVELIVCVYRVGRFIANLMLIGQCVIVIAEE